MRGVVDGELVVDGAGVDPRETLGDGDGVVVPAVRHAQQDGVAAHRRRVRLGAPQVGGLDDQGVAFPAPPRVAVPLANACRQMPAPVDGDDPEVVDHLDVDGDVARRLHDHEVVVVGAGQHRRAGRPHQAAVVQLEVLPRVERPFDGERGVVRHLAVGGLRRPRRQPARRGVGDQGRPAGRPRAPVEPEVVVAADVAPGHGPARRGDQEILVALHPGLLLRRHLLGGQELLVAQRLRAFERRRRLVGVGALQVRIAPRRPGRVLGGGRRRREQKRGQGGRGQACACHLWYLPSGSLVRGGAPSARRARSVRLYARPSPAAPSPDTPAQ